MLGSIFPHFHQADPQVLDPHLNRNPAADAVAAVASAVVLANAALKI